MCPPSFPNFQLFYVHCGLLQPKIKNLPSNPKKNKVRNIRNTRRWVRWYFATLLRSSSYFPLSYLYFGVTLTFKRLLQKIMGLIIFNRWVSLKLVYPCVPLDPLFYRSIILLLLSREFSGMIHWLTINNHPSNPQQPVHSLLIKHQ